MSIYLLPTSSDFIDIVAKAIAKNRVHQSVSTTFEDATGISLESSDILESSFEKVFDDIWNGLTAEDERERSQYRSDARAVIAAINLKLLVSPE